MPLLVSLYEPIAADLEKVCRIFDDELFSELPFINELCTHVRRYRGKMLRPALLLLSGKACGPVAKEHLMLAAVVEMVHMATLVHDDVLDEADLRRRCPTISRLQGNEAAVLLGDYLFSHAFNLCNSIGSAEVSRIMGATTNTVCEGELQQVHHRGDLGLTLQQYLQIITRKTAALTGTCCLLGARLAEAPARMSQALEQYGTDLGIAFQITDDVLDITGTEEATGKTLGRDLDKHKLTLPVIHCLSQASPAARSKIHAMLTAGAQDRDRLRDTLEAAGSLAFALEEAARYVRSAVRQLDLLPASDARDTLARMAQVIVDRDQ